MDKILEKINKLSLPAVILIAAIILGGFYFAVEYNKQRSIEKQQQIKIEQEMQEKLAEQQVKEEAEQALDTCIANAEESYHNQWDRECKALDRLTSKCIDINELSYDEYLKKYGLTDEEYKKQRGITDDSSLAGLLDYFKRQNEECSCRLPSYNADNINENLEKDKAECFKRYPQN